MQEHITKRKEIMELKVKFLEICTSETAHSKHEQQCCSLHNDIHHTLVFFFPTRIAI